jgi:hypothetical protein
VLVSLLCTIQYYYYVRFHSPIDLQSESPISQRLLTPLPPRLQKQEPYPRGPQLALACKSPRPLNPCGKTHTVWPCTSNTRGKTHTLWPYTSNPRDISHTFWPSTSNMAQQAPQIATTWLHDGGYEDGFQSSQESNNPLILRSAALLVLEKGRRQRRSLQKYKYIYIYASPPTKAYMFNVCRCRDTWRSRGAMQYFLRSTLRTWTPTQVSQNFELV